MKRSRISEYDFIKRANEFKLAVEKAEKKYCVTLNAGYINSWDDSENLIITDDETDEEVYFRTLADFL